MSLILSCLDWNCLSCANYVAVEIKWSSRKTIFYKFTHICLRDDITMPAAEPSWQVFLYSSFFSNSCSSNRCSFPYFSRFKFCKIKNLCLTVLAPVHAMLILVILLCSFLLRLLPERQASRSLLALAGRWPWKCQQCGSRGAGNYGRREFRYGSFKGCVGGQDRSWTSEWHASHVLWSRQWKEGLRAGFRTGENLG